MTEQTIELAVQLPSETLARLAAEAKRLELPLSDVVRDAIEIYLDELEDTPDEDILNSLRIGFTEALEGRVRPAREVLDEIRRELADDDNES